VEILRCDRGDAAQKQEGDHIEGGRDEISGLRVSIHMKRGDLPQRLSMRRVALVS
jgi:hypothetical protein